jgi:hypothetical protein
MNGNGSSTNGSTSAAVLRWPGRVLAFEDVRRNLNGHRELVLGPDTVLSPLASEELRDRGVKVTRLDPEPPAPWGPVWGYGQTRSHEMVHSAVRSLARVGLRIRELDPPGDLACRWAKAVAECIAAGICAGGVLFCEDPGLLCCVANKVPGLRAVPVVTVAQAARALRTLAANLLAVEMPGRTFFEVKQMFQLLSTPVGCPDGVACTLRELDGHAHR